MKKVFTAILALVYLGTSTGATIHMHYCMGRLAGWGFTHSNSATCPTCGMEKSAQKNTGCCKDEHKFVKNNADQKGAESALEIMQGLTVIQPVDFIETPSCNLPSLTNVNHLIHGPPRNSSTAVFIRNCVFLI